MTAVDPTPRRSPIAPARGAVDRRAVLRALAVLGAGGALAACGGSATVSDGAGTATSEPAAGAPSDAGDPGGDALARVAPDAEASLAVVAATFEQLIGEPNPFVFGLFTLEQAPVDDAAAQVYVVPPGGGEPVGPFDARWAGGDAAPPEGADGAHSSEGGGDTDVFRSLYAVDAAFDATGVHEVVVVTDDGRGGTVAVDVRDRATSQLPAPGEQATAVPTPTVADPLDYQTLCTRRPEPCGMHDVSLDAALAEGRPIALLFATPAFCQTAVCGPTVDVIEQVRTDYDDVVFIHCEIFSDDGATVGDPVAAWELPTEPWLFVIAPDGTITHRADGPLLVLADAVRSLVDTGSAA